MKDDIGDILDSTYKEVCPNPPVFSAPDISHSSISPDSILITSGNVDLLRSKKGGWSADVFKPLGIDITKKGWKNLLLGRSISLSLLPPEIRGRFCSSNARPPVAFKNRLLPTEKQIDYLIALGVEEETARQMGIKEASDTIQRLKQQPSHSQVKYAKALGASAQQLKDNFERKRMGELIDTLLKKKGKRH